MTTRLVPSQYPTIAAAMAASIDGDVIQLAASYTGESAVVTRNGIYITGVSTNTGISLTLAAGVTFFGLEGSAPINVTASDTSATIIGSSGANTLTGGSGDDVLRGFSGADTLIGGLGSDTADYTTSSAVTVNLLTGAASGGHATGDTFNSIENVIGGFGDDVLTGNAQANSLVGYMGADTLVGGDGNDTLDGGAGADRLNGGAGLDSVSYLTATGSVSLNMATGAHTGDAQGDVITEVEGFRLTRFRDAFFGAGGGEYVSLEGGDDVAYGNDGDDYLAGGDGNDVLSGGWGADTLIAGAGLDSVDYLPASFGVIVDLVTGVNTNEARGDVITEVEGFRLTAFADQFNGGGGGNYVTLNAGNDIAWGNDGDDYLFGEDGDDYLDGGSGADQIDGGAGADTVIGGDGNDFLSGGATGNDALYGGDGIDILIGGGGSDLLVGGPGGDALTGGRGEGDRFAYTGLNDSSFSDPGGRDTITDFEHGLDVIDLSGAVTSPAASFALSVVGNNTYIFADVNGDGATDYWIILQGVTNVTSSDILL